MRHALQLAGITLFGWSRYRLGLSNSRWIVDSREQLEFPSFCRGFWQSPCTAQAASKYLSLMPCKETVKGSTSHPYPPCNRWNEKFDFTVCVRVLISRAHGKKQVRVGLLIIISRRHRMDYHNLIFGNITYIGNICCCWQHLFAAALVSLFLFHQYVS